MAGCIERVHAEGLNCPLPLLKTKKALAGLPAGQRVYLRATDPNTLRDLRAFAAEAGHGIEYVEKQGNLFHIVITKHTRSPTDA